MKKYVIKEGDIVTPKVYPQLKSKVVAIKTFAGETVCFLENGTRYTKEELSSNQEFEDCVE